jgi:hypothetical protein
MTLVSGTKWEDLDGKSNIIKFYSDSLFTSEVHEPDAAVLDKVRSKVTSDMNNDLLAPFSEAEVKKALFQIRDFKAPGPDGLHAIFYKRFW